MHVPDTGATLRVEVRLDHDNVGAYELYLWNSDATERELILEGISEDNIADAIDFEAPLDQFDGRILDCFVTIINPGSDEGEYAVAVVGSQNGNDLEQSVSSGGPIGSQHLTRRLALKIKVGGNEE